MVASQKSESIAKSLSKKGDFKYQMPWFGEFPYK